MSTVMSPREGRVRVSCCSRGELLIGPVRLKPLDKCHCHNHEGSQERR